MWHIGPVAVPANAQASTIAQFIFTSLMVLSVILRFATRLTFLRKVGLGYDDLFIAIAATSHVGCFVAGIYQLKYGLGRPEVAYQHISQFLFTVFMNIVTYNVTGAACRLAILFQYKRICVVTKLVPWFMVWTVVFGLFSVLASVFTCIPVHKYWDFDPIGSCLDKGSLQYAISGINIVNDIVVLVLPLPHFYSLQIPRKSKVMLTAIFTCGGFACVVAIVRLHALYVTYSSPVIEQPINGIAIGLWSALEVDIGIICACVPALKPLFARWLPSLFKSRNSNSSRYESQGTSRTARSAMSRRLGRRIGSFSFEEDNDSELGLSTRRTRDEESVVDHPPPAYSGHGLKDGEVVEQVRKHSVSGSGSLSSNTEIGHW